MALEKQELSNRNLPGKDSQELPKKKKQTKMKAKALILVVFAFVILIFFGLRLGNVQQPIKIAPENPPTSGASSEESSSDGGSFLEKESQTGGDEGLPDLPGNQGLSVIEGSLGYPSEFIPPMKVCAQEIETGELFCSSEQIQDPRFTQGIGYRMEVPQGEYQVYAQAINEGGAMPDDYKAFYSEFVVCGLSVECDSHSPVSVNVVQGETKSGIDPIDWYDFSSVQN